MMHTPSSQGITKSYEPASILSRASALAIDMALLAVTYNVLMTALDSQIKQADWTLKIIMAVIPLLYPLIAEILSNGQTLGKRVLSIRVVSVEDDKASIVSLLLRWFLMPFDLIFACGLGELCVFFTKRQQRIGDLIAKTYVVKLKNKTK